jgi:capsular polysaccharide biosynthesis protein
MTTVALPFNRGNRANWGGKLASAVAGVIVILVLKGLARELELASTPSTLIWDVVQAPNKNTDIITASVKCRWDNEGKSIPQPINLND